VISLGWAIAYRSHLNWRVRSTLGNDVLMSKFGFRATLEKSPEQVAAMFDRVARRYDITNDLLSLWQTRRWRAAVKEVINPKKGDVVLDLAAGTGTSSLPLSATGADVIACDFSVGMLEVGKVRQRDSAIAWGFTAGDAMQLPFADSTFDAVTISFGIRNVHDFHKGLAEMLRVTKPGGRLVICEFSHPTSSLFRRFYLGYLMRALPKIAARTSSNPDAYHYLAESIRAWPDQKTFATNIQNAGWQKVSWRNFSAGIVAIHQAQKAI